MIAYYFPPLGGSGVQRAVKFARYLPEAGYDPVVLTGPGDAVLVPDDPSLSAELSANLEVLRAAGPEPRPNMGRRGQAERWLRLRTPWTRWWVEEATRLGRTARNIDVVLATMSPFQSADVAAMVSNALRVPWIADLRDPWALDEMQVQETVVHRALEMRLMRRSLRSAELIVMNTHEAAAAVGRAFPELAARATSIPNGFDAEDFAGLEPERADRAFRIVHAGLLHTELGLAHRRGERRRRLLGGALGGVDIEPRSHVYLMRALERLAQTDPQLRAAVELHLVGNLSAADRAILPDGLVIEHGYQSHHATRALVRDADLLFLPMHDVHPGYRTRIVPGKTYEYLASGRPILAAVPDGDARDLLHRSPAARLVRPKDVDGMVAVVRDEITSVLEHGRRPSVRLDWFADYDRRQLTERLATALDRARGAAGDLRPRPQLAGDGA
jgi:hypothetical protein